MSIELKIKAKHLAAEAAIIRKEASKTSGMPKWELNHHRTTTVRDAARHTHLARGYLDYMPYRRIEQKGSKELRFNSILNMVLKYGAEKDRDTVYLRLKAWLAVE